MKKILENVGIIFCCFVIFGFMLTGTFVFARDTKGVENKSYYIEKEEKANGYKEKTNFTLFFLIHIIIIC